MLRCFNSNCKNNTSSINFAKLVIFAKTINIVTLKYLQLNLALNYIKQAY